MITNYNRWPLHGDKYYRDIVAYLTEWPEDWQIEFIYKDKPDLITILKLYKEANYVEPI